MKKRRTARRPGQALVEFVMVVPLLMLLLLGVYEFGRAWNIYQVMSDAARDAARSGAVDNDAIDADSVYSIVNHALARARIDTTAETTTLAGFDGPPDTYLTVTISYSHQFRLIDGLLAWTIGQSTFEMTTSNAARNE